MIFQIMDRVRVNCAKDIVFGRLSNIHNLHAHGHDVQDVRENDEGVHESDGRVRLF